MRWLACLGLVLLNAADAAPRIDPGRAMDRAQAAALSGDVVPERDLAPVLEAYLDLARRDDSSHLAYSLNIDRLARAEGPSPLVVKAWFREHAPAYLLPLIEGRTAAGPRARAVLMLGSMQLDDATLSRVLEAASADPELANAVARVRADLRQKPVVRLAPVDADRERRAIAFLAPRNIGVNADSLRQAAGEGDLTTVEALLDAGVAADARGIAGMNAVSQVVSFGCAENVPAEDLVATLKLLQKRGAGIGGADANGDTYLLNAARSRCPAAVIETLIDLGEPPDVRGSRGLTPLELAIAAANLDAADVLVRRGARLTAKQIDRLFIEPPTDARMVALLERAQGR